MIEVQSWTIERYPEDPSSSQPTPERLQLSCTPSDVFAALGIDESGQHPAQVNELLRERLALVLGLQVRLGDTWFPVSMTGLRARFTVRSIFSRQAVVQLTLRPSEDLARRLRLAPRYADELTLALETL